MKQDASIYRIWLAEAINRSGTVYRKLIGQFDDPEKLYRADDEQIRAIPGLSGQVRSALLNRDLTAAGKILDACERMGIRLLHSGMREFPSALRDIAAPPPLLYYVGKLPEFDGRFHIGMVGTRRMTRSGMENGYRLAYELASAGAVIVSGLAEGIDGVCAAAALEAGGATVAVTGCGLDIAYPRHHAYLMRCIARNGGAILSEYPPGTQPAGYHFPTRNRLISGLSQAVIVVEAGPESGSLITAKEAVVQGRELFTIPCDIANPGAEGNNLLLRDGAMVVLHAQDIVDRFRYLFDRKPLAPKVRTPEPGTAGEVLTRYGVIRPGAFSEIGSRAASEPARQTSRPTERPIREPKPTRERIPAPKPEPEAHRPEETPEPTRNADSAAATASLTPVQKAVLEAMPDDCPVAAESLMTGYSFGEVLAALTVLELSGIVRKLPGSMYGKV